MTLKHRVSWVRMAVYELHRRFDFLLALEPAFTKQLETFEGSTSIDRQTHANFSVFSHKQCLQNDINIYKFHL